MVPPVEPQRLALKLPLAAHQRPLDLDDRVVGPRAPSPEKVDLTASDHHLVAQGEMLDFKPDPLVGRESFRTSIQDMNIAVSPLNNQDLERIIP
jgi:hypothetical protein